MEPVRLARERSEIPIFYRGAGVGTWWYEHDARPSGFNAKAPGTPHSVDRVMEHVARGNVYSPYISLTRSFGVAREYAFVGRKQATQANPGYVYELEINDPLPDGLQLLDPVKVVADAAPQPLASPPYQHDGPRQFLLRVVDPVPFGEVFCVQPPPESGTRRTPNLSLELETLVRALRDAEILAFGIISASCVINRYDVAPEEISQG